MPQRQGSPEIGILVIQTLLFVSVVLRPSSFRKTLILPIALAFIYVVFYTSVEDVMLCHAVGDTAMCYLLNASDYILLTDVQTRLRRIGQKQPASTFSLRGRIKWAAHLLFSPRGVGWTHGHPKYHPKTPIPSQSTSSWPFVSSRLLLALANFVLFDIGSVLLLWLSQNYTRLAHPETLTWLEWVQIRLAYIAFPIWVFSRLNAGHLLAAAFTVAFKVCRPEDWPPLFGSIRHGYTVRNVWNKVWHQGFRRIIVVHADFVVQDVLRLPVGTLSKFVRIAVGFFITGMLHAPGDYVALGRWSRDTMLFFTLQGVAIIFEHFAIQLGVSIGLSPSRFWKGVGYLWVLTWFLSLPPLLADQHLGSGGFANALDSTVFIRHFAS